MVDAGRVLFQVGIDRASIDRSIADLERRLANVGNVDLRLPNTTAATGVARQVENAFSNIRIPEFNFTGNTQQLRRTVQEAESELLSLEAAIAGIQRQRIDVDVRVTRGDADIARIEERILRLQRQRINIPTVSLEGGASIRRIEAQIEQLNSRRIRIEADTADARSELSQLDRTLDDLSGDNAAQTLARLQREINETGQAADNAGRGLGSFDSILGGLAAGATVAVLDAVTDSLGRLVDATAQFVSSTIEVGGAARLAENAFTTILGSADEAQSTLQDLNNFAATTPFDLPGIRQAGQQLLAFGFTTDELIPTLDAIGNVAAGVNQPFGEIAEIFGRARVQGRLFAEDINQLTGRGIPIIGELASQFGVAETEIRGLVESGQVGFADIEQAFINLTSEGGRFFNLLGSRSATAVGQISNLGDTFTQFQEQLFRAFEPALGAGLTVLTDTLDEVAGRSQALDILSEAGERLALALESNPELAERLGEALATLADSGAEVAAAFLEEISEIVSNPENIEAFAQNIEQLATNIEFIGTAAANSIDFILGFANAFTEVSNRVVPSLRLLNLAQDVINRFSGGNEEPEIEVPTFGGIGNVDISFVETFNQASQQIAENDGRAARQAAAERNRANQEAAEEFVRAQDQALSDLEISQQNRIAAIRQNQASGLITSDEADSQVSQIEIDSIRERIALREDEIARVEELASSQVLSEEEASQRIRAAREEISSLTLDAIEQEIAAQDEARQAAERRAEEARRAILDQLDAQQRLNDLQAEQINIQSGIASTALQDQSNLISAQVNLEQSRLSLSRQTLDAKLAEAQATEDVVGIESARDRILVNQQQSIAAEFNARRQQLEIQRQINALDADRQLRLGQIAEAEARIAVQRAEANDGSDEEVQALREIVNLREQETDALEDQASNAENVLTLQLEQLDAEQQLASQRANQERREQAIESLREQQRDLAREQVDAERDLASATERRQRATDGIVSSLADLQDVSAEDALSQLDQLEQNLRTAQRAGAIDGDQSQQLQQAIDEAQRFGRGGFDIEEAFRFAQQDNQFNEGILNQLGFGGVTSLLDAQQEIAIADSQIEQLTTGLTEVREAIEALPDLIPAGVENLTVSTPDPVADAAEITAQMNRQQRIARGLV